MAVVAIGFATGCSSGAGSRPQADLSSRAPGPTTAAPTPTALKPPPQISRAVPTPGAPLGTGDYFGYLESIDEGHRTVRVDLAQMLTGKRAVAAALADGYISDPKAGVPNDYYVRNPSRRTRVLSLAADVAVTVPRCLTDRPCAQYPAALSGLAASLRQSGTFDLTSPYRGRNGSYWLTVVGDRITRIDEVYLP